MSSQQRELLGRVAGFFQQRGIEAYVVGGTVRDWLLGRPSQDLDLAVAGDVLALTRALANELGAAYVPLDDERATARAVLRGADHRYVDVARLQADTVEADLFRRDFTINAMAIRLEDAAAGHFNIIDPTGGRGDLAQGRLRVTSEAALRDDPLRMLRAVRLAAGLDFTIEPQTQRWITDLAEAIHVPARERVRDELVRLFACEGTANYLRLLDDLGLLAPLLPELVAGKGITQPAIHQWDVFEHSLMTVDRIEWIPGVLDGSISGEHGVGSTLSNEAYKQVRDCLSPFATRLQTHLQAELVEGRSRYSLLKWLALLHDVGKPPTRTMDQAGHIHFHGHEQVGAEMAAKILRRLHFGAQEVKIGRMVTYHHMRPKWLAASEQMTPRAIYRFFREAGEAGVDIVLLSLADSLAARDVLEANAAWRAQLDVTDRLLKAWFERRETAVAPPALVRGDEFIAAFNLTPGPIVGQLLEAVREGQVANLISTRDEAFAFAREWLSTPHKDTEAVAKGGNSDVTNIS